ncbi:MAG: hypothetical protein HUJ60_04435 [Bacilli bacterium]|nr:hypothetical protein [Bacilli bacterium]
MSQEVAIVVAICIVVALLVIFFVSFVLYRKTPAPKGCENLEPDEGLCSACEKANCPLRVPSKEENK